MKSDIERMLELAGLSENETYVFSLKYSDSANEIFQRIKSFFPQVEKMDKKGYALVHFNVPDYDGKAYASVICGEDENGFYSENRGNRYNFINLEELIKHIEQYTQVERPN